MVFLTTLLAVAFWGYGFASPCNNPKVIKTFAAQTESCSEMNTVPSDVLQRFYDTYMYDEQGRFAGAYIGEIELYATMPEIINIVTNTGGTLAGTVIYEGYKPRLRGCKKNSKWICTVEGDVVDL